MDRNLFVHDEILLEVPIEATDEAALILRETMEGVGRTLLKTVPVEAQVGVAGSWVEKRFVRPFCQKRHMQHE